LKIGVLLALLLLSNQGFAQELEPRRWSWLPDGSSFLGLAAGNSTGDVLFDPVLQLRDVKLDYATLGASYIHSFGFFGKPARIDINLPYASARWEGFLNDVPASTRRRGFIDPYLRLSINLYGAPVLKGKAFQQFMAEHPINTTIGAAIALISPWGEYRSDKLINLGNNRWALRPQLGVLHAHNKWQFETTGAVFLYMDNTEFVPGTQVREQDPLWSIQGHVIYTFRPGLWASVSGGFAWGGESTVGDRPVGDESRMPLWALSFGVPITPRQGLKFTYLISRTNTDTGSDLGTYQLTWSTMVGH
jgi:hypothetical protein